MLMYPDHFQNWLDYGYSLLIFLTLMLFWFSETGKICGFCAFWSSSVDFPHYGDPLAEIFGCHIWGFWALSGECVGVNVKGRAEAYLRRFVSSCVLFCNTCKQCWKFSWKSYRTVGPVSVKSFRSYWEILGPTNEGQRPECERCGRKALIRVLGACPPRKMWGKWSNLGAIWCIL